MEFEMGKIVSVLILAIGLTGCAASGKQFSGLSEINDGTATAYLYRQKAFFAGGAMGEVILDDKKAGFIRNGGYISKSLEAGKHTLAVRGETVKSVDFEAKANETLCFKTSPRPGIVGARFTLTAVDLETCKTEMNGLKESINTVQDNI